MAYFKTTNTELARLEEQARNMEVEMKWLAIIMVLVFIALVVRVYM